MSKFFKNEDKAAYIQRMFDSIAKDYDFMNEIISFGRDRIIKKHIVKDLDLNNNADILDICTGTGDFAIYLAKNFPEAKIKALDFSEKMLDIARNKAKGLNNIEFIQGDALNLPFNDESFDACVVGYGLRNLSNVEKGISEMYRITKHGGLAVSLDFGKPNGLKSILFDIYFFNIVPFLGKIFHGNESPYTYLPESVKEFPSPEKLMQIFTNVGFKEVKNRTFALGALALQTARK